MIGLSRLLALSLVLACAATGCKRNEGTAGATPVESGPSIAAARAPAPDPLKLVVIVVIDQLPSWSFTRDAEHLGGGLGRLVRESVFFPEADYPFANTYTAVGHAAIGTGAPPSVSGIIANGWYRRDLERFWGATDDPDYPVFVMSPDESGELAAAAAEGAAPTALRVDGLADQLARERPRARTISIGLKQRAAVLQTGRRPDLAIWYEAPQQAMTTGRFYAKAPPPWLVAFNREQPLTSRLGSTWDVEDDDFLLEHCGAPDDSPGEGANVGFDTSFPHPLADLDPAKALRATPAGVELLFDTARAAIAGEKLGGRGVTDLLAITVSSHDYAGHYWGQESWERFDILRHVDRVLGEFMAHLDETVGKDGYAMVLTSDHGAVPLIERSTVSGLPARRIHVPKVLAAADSALDRVLGKGDWVIGKGANSIYLAPRFSSQPENKKKQALDAAVGALRAIDGVSFAAATAELAGDCDRHEDENARLLCNSIHPGATGELMVIPDRYSIFIEPRFPTGTGHGTPSPECRLVPVLVKAPGIEPRRASEPVTVLQVAPTIAKLLGIDPPPAATEPPLPLRPAAPR